MTWDGRAERELVRARRRRQMANGGLIILALAVVLLVWVAMSTTG